MIILIKSVILKFTLVTLLIKLFRKYKFFRGIWTVVKTTIFSIFGISIIDNFGIEFISNFFKEIRIITSSIVVYLSETQFYSFVASLFSKKEEVTKDKISIWEKDELRENSRIKPNF